MPIDIMSPIKALQSSALQLKYTQEAKENKEYKNARLMQEDIRLEQRDKSLSQKDEQLEIDRDKQASFAEQVKAQQYKNETDRMLAEQNIKTAQNNDKLAIEKQKTARARAKAREAKWNNNNKEYYEKSLNAMREDIFSSVMSMIKTRTSLDNEGVE
jgi:hypothetical protein